MFSPSRGEVAPKRSRRYPRTSSRQLRFDDSFADGLIQEAVRLEAEAIVVGGSGGGLAGSYSLGSVVNDLLHSAPVPSRWHHGVPANQRSAVSAR